MEKITLLNDIEINIEDYKDIVVEDRIRTTINGTEIQSTYSFGIILKSEFAHTCEFLDKDARDKYLNETKELIEDKLEEIEKK